MRRSGKNCPTFSPNLRAFGKKVSVFSPPSRRLYQLSRFSCRSSSALPSPRRRRLARVTRALSEFSFFCLHRALFCLQSVDGEMVACEGFTMQMRVEYLCNRLSHSVLCVKARGALFGALPSPSVPPRRGAFSTAVFVVPPPTRRACRGEGSCLYPLNH